MFFFFLCFDILICYLLIQYSYLCFIDKPVVVVWTAPTVVDPWVGASAGKAASGDVETAPRVMEAASNVVTKGCFRGGKVVCGTVASGARVGWRVVKTISIYKKKTIKVIQKKLPNIRDCIYLILIDPPWGIPDSQRYPLDLHLYEKDIVLFISGKG